MRRGASAPSGHHECGDDIPDQDDERHIAEATADAPAPELDGVSPGRGLVRTVAGAEDLLGLLMGAVEVAPRLLGVDEMAVGGAALPGEGGNAGSPLWFSQRWTPMSRRSMRVRSVAACPEEGGTSTTRAGTAGAEA